MSDITFYRIEEFFTNGWDLIDNDSSKLTKEECDAKLQFYIEKGYNPQRLRAVRVVD